VLIFTENYRYQKLTENSVIIRVWGLRLGWDFFYRARGLGFMFRIGIGLGLVFGSLDFGKFSVVVG